METKPGLYLRKIGNEYDIVNLHYSTLSKVIFQGEVWGPLCTSALYLGICGQAARDMLAVCNNCNHRLYSLLGGDCSTLITSDSKPLEVKIK